MKIQLDTTNKEIVIEESVNLHEFYQTINNLLPGGEWRDFTLKIEKIVEWRDPINIPNPLTEPINPYSPLPDTTNPYPLFPDTHRIWYDSNTSTSIGTDDLVGGTYNLTIN